MKLSISVSAADLEALDSYVREAGLASRSAAIQRAIHLLRAPELEDAYADAWQEWTDSEDAAAWDLTAGDGLGRAAR